jgi:hypothetical protein
VRWLFGRGLRVILVVFSVHVHQDDPEQPGQTYYHLVESYQGCERQSREDVLAKVRKKLSGNGAALQKLVTHSSYRKYVREETKAKLVLNEDTIAGEAKRDGFFGIVTNIRDLKAGDIVAHYKTLWEVEDAFGELKGTLKARPIFHWSDGRIVGHLTLCFMAYLCEALMTKALRGKGFVLESPAIDKKIVEPRPLTVAEAMRELNEVRAIPVTLRGKTIWLRTDIAGNANELLAAIGRRPPPKILAQTQPDQAALIRGRREDGRGGAGVAEAATVPPEVRTRLPRVRKRTSGVRRAGNEELLARLIRGKYRASSRQPRQDFPRGGRALPGSSLAL